MSESNGIPKICTCCKGLRKEDGSRGCCRNCYQALAKQIREKKTTWEELVDLGLCLEKDGRSGSKGRIGVIIAAARKAKEEA